MIKINYIIFAALAVFLFSCSQDDTVAPKKVSLKSTGSWKILDGSAVDVAYGGWLNPNEGPYLGAAFYVIGTDDDGASGAGIYRFTRDGSWVKLDGAALRIAVDATGLPWVINRGFQIFRRNNSDQWQLMPGGAIDIGIGGPFNSVYVIGTDGAIYQWSEALHGWRKDESVWYGGVSNPTRIAVDSQGRPWVVNNLGFVYVKLQIQSTSPGISSTPVWQLMGTVGAYDIGAGADGSIFITSTSGLLYKLNGTNWDEADQVDGLARAVTVDLGGRPIVLNHQNLIYRHQ